MVDVWLEVEAHQHQAPASAIMLQCLFVPLLGGAPDQAVVDDSVAKPRKVLGVYEARLAASRFLAGESLSIADLSHFPVMRYFMETEHAALVEALPHVKAWWEELAGGEELGSRSSSCRRTLGSGTRPNNELDDYCNNLQ